MPKATSCPDEGQLKKLAIADFAPEEMEPLLQHLQDCNACLSRVQTLAPNDTLATALAKAKSLADNPDDPVVTGLIARLSKLSQAPAEAPPSKLTFACGNCGKNLKVKPELAGKKVKCPGCGQAIPVPQNPRSDSPGLGSASEKTLPPTPSRVLDISDERTILPTGGDTKAGLSGIRGSRKKIASDATEAMSPPSDEFDFLAPPQEPDEVGRLGQYRVLRKLGAGGMGMVLLAEDTLLHRQVALKVMLPQFAASDSARERFLREARAAAKVEHENVVTILQVGEDNNVPFLAMPFLKGKPLDDVLEKKSKLPVAEALRIAAEMAEGLAAAHAMGLIHRDIKPGNVWLETRARKESEKRKDETEPPPSSYKVKLLDFGLARSEDDTKLTQSGALIGTPAYMAPEQAKGESVDARADLFSLGCVLYVMLTGERPFKGENTISLLTALALENPETPQVLNPDVPKDVSEFTMWLLEKNPNDRPASAAEVATELAELRGDQTADETRLAGSTRRLRPLKSSARQPRGWLGRVAIALAVVVGLAGATVGGLYLGGIILVPTAKGTLVIEIDDPNVEVLVKQGGVKLFDPTTKRQLDLKVGDYEIDIADAKEGWKFSTKQFTITRDGATKVKIWLDRAVAANSLSNGVNLDPAKIPAEERYPGQPKDLVAVLGEHLAWQSPPREQGQRGRQQNISFSADGKSLVTSSGASGACVWDSADLRLRQVLTTQPVFSAAFAPDNKTVALGGRNGIALMDLSKENPENSLGMNGPILSLAFSPKGKLLAAANLLGEGKLWDFSGEAPQQKAFPQKVFSVSFAPDGKTLATGSDKDQVRLWNVTAAEPQELAVSASPPNADYTVRKVLFSPDGNAVASHHMDAQGDERVRIWQVKGNSLKARPMPKNENDSGDPAGIPLAFDIHGTTLLVGPMNILNHPFRFLSLSSPQVTIAKTFWGHAYAAAACYSPGGKTLASMGDDGVVRLWNMADKEITVRATGHADRVLSLAFSPDGKMLASGGRDSKLLLWDLSGSAPKESAVLKEHRSPVGYLRFAPDGKSFVSGSQGVFGFHGSESFLWKLNPEGPKGVKLFDGAQEVRFVTFSADSKPELAGFQDKGQLRLLDVSSRKVKELPAPETPWTRSPPPFLGETALSPDDKWLAFNLSEGNTPAQRTIRLWQIDGKSITERPGFEHGEALHLLRFAPDGKTLAAASTHIQLWDLQKRKQNLIVDRDLSRKPVITCGIYSPDGKTLYVADASNRIIALDVLQTGDDRDDSKDRQWQMPLPIHSLALSPDGRYLATGNGNGTIYILQVAKDPVVAVKPVETKPEEKLPASASPLDRLDPAQISVDNQRSWLPKETVAVVGEFKGRMPGAIHHLAVGPDGKWLMCFGGGGLIDVYDAATLRFHCELKPPAGRKDHGVEFLSGNVVCAFGALWDLSGTEPSRLADLPRLDPVAVVAAPKAARLAARFPDGSIHVWDWGDGKLKERGVVNHPTTFNLLRFLPDGDTLISSDSGGSLRLWDLKESAPRVITDVKDAIPATQTWRLAVSPNGKLLATYEKNKSGRPDSVIVWDVTNPKQPGQRKLPANGLEFGRALAFSPDSTLLAVLLQSGSEPGVQLWPVDGAASVPKTEYTVPAVHNVHSVAFASDGKKLFVGAALWESGSIRLLDFDGAKLTNRWQPHDAVLGPVFSPDGQTLATSLPHGNSWWDLTAAAPRERKLPSHYRAFCGFSQDGVFFTGEGALSEWNGKKIRLIMNRPDNASHAISVDGGTAVFAYIDGGGVEIADIKGGKWQKEAFFSVPGQALFLRSDSKALAVSNIWGAAKPTSHLFQRDGSGWKQTWNGTRPVALSQRGDRFAVAEADGLLIFDISGPEPREVAKVPVRGSSHMSFAPEGGIVAVVTRRLLGNGIDIHVVVIDVESGERLHTWRFPADVGVSFAPDGRHLAVDLQHGATLILRVPATKGKS